MALIKVDVPDLFGGTPNGGAMRRSAACGSRPQ